MDLTLSLAFAVVAMALASGHRLTHRARGRRIHPRVAREGGSALLQRGAMEPLYAVVVAVGKAVRKLGVTPDAVTGISIAFAAGAGVLLGAGHFGAAAIAATLAGGCDALDGWVARATGKVSASGAIFDATADRYVEFAFFAGLAFHYRTSTVMFALVLAALVGSFMVSYASAKAEAHPEGVPRGAMRRFERVLYLVTGIALVPIAGALSPELADAPLALALGLIGAVGNASAVHRLRALGRSMDARAAAATTLAADPRAAARVVHIRRGGELRAHRTAHPADVAPDEAVR